MSKYLSIVIVVLCAALYVSVSKLNLVSGRLKDSKAELSYLSKSIDKYKKDLGDLDEVVKSSIDKNGKLERDYEALREQLRNNGNACFNSVVPIDIIDSLRKQRENINKTANIKNP